jgi:hypothetical protein
MNPTRQTAATPARRLIAALLSSTIGISNRDPAGEFKPIGPRRRRRTEGGFDAVEYAP